MSGTRTVGALSTAGEVAGDLERWLEGRPILARPVSPPFAPGVGRNEIESLAAATLVALASVTTAIFLFLSRKNSDARDFPRQKHRGPAFRKSQ